MPNFGQPDLKIFVSTASNSNATVREISNYVDTFNGVALEALTQQSDAFGDSWVENLYVGVKKMDDMTMEGFYEDTAASSPHAIFGDMAHLGNERNFEINHGASDLVNGKCLIAKYERLPKRGELTRFRVTLRPTGAIGTAS